jgi:hypothetical protein
MNRKQIVILLGVLGVLLLAVVVKRLAPRPEVYEEEVQSLKIAFSPETATRLVLGKGAGEQDRVELQRANGFWRIPSLWNAKADAEKVERFLGSLSALKGEVRSEADAVLSDYGITDEQALHVTVFQEARPVLHLLLGTAQAGWQQLFIRQANSSTVFLTQSDLLSEMGIYGQVSDTTTPTADVWADLRFLAFSPEAIARVEVKEKGADWQELGGQLPFERDAAKVQTYLQELVNLRAQRVVDPAGTAYGFAEPAWQLRFVKNEGTPVLLTVGAPTAEASTDRYLRVEGAPDVYAVSGYTLDRIKVDGSRFIGEDPLNVGAAKHDTLTVTVPGNEATAAIQKDRWAGLDEYLQALKTFRVSKTQELPDRAKTELNTPYQLTLSGGSESLTIACEAPVTAETNEIVCINRKKAIPFIVDRPTFQAVFERVERLERPAPAPQEPPAAASGPSETSDEAGPVEGDHKDETKP